MLNVILYEPEIPPNTGNIIRLCANTGADLHLIEPLGFRMEDRELRRAGLDYHEYARVNVYPDLDSALQRLHPTRLIACSVRGTCAHTDIHYQAGDSLLFGPETRGLPAELLEGPLVNQCVRIPMRPQGRSLNLSNAVAVVVFEAWRQLGFQGGA